MDIVAFALTVAAAAEHLTVFWHAPVQGGVLAGVSSETVGFLLPLAARDDVTLVHVDGFSPTSTFVAGLPRLHQQALRTQPRFRLDDVAKTLAIERRRCIHVIGWDPGYYRAKLKLVRRVGAVALPTASAVAQLRRCAVAGRVMFETDTLPPHWLDSIRELDEVWVPSRFMQDIVARALGAEAQRCDAGAEECAASATATATATTRVHIPIKVLHEPLDTRDWFGAPHPGREAARERLLPAGCPHDAIVFLSVFKWERRKSGRALIAAFDAEFGNARDARSACLVLRTKLPEGTTLDALRAVAEDGAAAAAPRPYIATVPQLAGLDYALLFAAANVFVLPSHGEGWGRTLVEGMAMGLPVIGTNWGGATEFLNASNSLLLPVSSLELAAEGVRRGGGGPAADVDDVFSAASVGKWAAIEPDALRAVLRRAFEMTPAERKALGRAARASAIQFDQRVVGGQLHGLLRSAAHPLRRGETEQ